MNSSIPSLYTYGRPEDIQLGLLERWLKEGKLSKEALLEPNQNETPWIVEWLTRKTSKTRSELMKFYESPAELIRLGLSLIEQAQGWDLSWMDDRGVITPRDAEGNQRPSKIADLLLWRSSDDMLWEWKKTVANDHLKKLVTSRLYADGTKASPKTALQMAVFKERTAVMKGMVEHGADIHALSPNGQTAVFDAKSVKTLQYLVKLGADLSQKDNAGQLPAEVWIKDPNARADLMIGPLLKAHLEAFPPHVVLQAVIEHTIRKLPFGSDNKPTALYRQVKNQLHVPFELNGRSQTLLGLWAEHALEKKEPERLQWALRLQPQETEAAPGVTDGDLARLASTMKNLGTFHSSKDAQSWGKMVRAYEVALSLPMGDRTALFTFPTTLLDTLLHQSPTLIDQRLERLGMPEGPTSRLSRAMAWVTENHGCTPAGHYYSVGKSTLMNFLTQHQPPEDTLAAALLLLSRNTGRTRELDEEHPLQKDQWISPATLVINPNHWNEQLLLAAWCQNASLARQSQGSPTPEEWAALAQCNARMQEAGNGLEWVTQRWESMAKQRFLNQQLPTPVQTAERLRF